MDATLFDGDLMAGPFPTLFSEDEDATLASLVAEPCKAHWDLMKIQRAFFMPENIDIGETLDLLRKPKEGAAVLCFRRPRLALAILEANRPAEEDLVDDSVSQGPSRGRARGSSRRGRSPSLERSPSPSPSEADSRPPPPKRANMNVNSNSGVEN